MLFEGGRYDGLVESCGGPNVGGIGFAIGIERLLMALKGQSFWWRNVNRDPVVFIVHSGSEASMDFCLFLQNYLASAEIEVMVDFVKGSIKSQMRLANNRNVDFVLIAGDSEIETRELSLKIMQTGEQLKIYEKNIIEEIKERFRGITEHTRRRNK